MKNVFLSASIPLVERDPKYIGTADVVAIRDSVRALASIVLPKCRLIWGGHPAISPLIKYVLDRMHISVKDHITTYQSLFFDKQYSDDHLFGTIKYVKKIGDLDESLKQMRQIMLGRHRYVAGIFIGGMEGVESEFDMFRELQGNNVRVLPIASTGAAAKRLFRKNPESYDKRLLNDYAYNDLFTELLEEIVDEIKNQHD
jgi:hypothetical protein